MMILKLIWRIPATARILADSKLLFIIVIIYSFVYGGWAHVGSKKTYWRARKNDRSSNQLK